nr:XkdX family protein [uncultured Dysosmobacter sp.]
MYNRLKRLYCEGRLDDTALQNAAERGWITDEQKQEIVDAAKDERAKG